MMKKVLVLVVLLIISCSKRAEKPYASFNHVGIYVADVNKSAAFYQNLFHLDTVNNPFPGQHIKWLLLGKHQLLHIIEGKKSEIVIPPENHIAFSVASLKPFIAVLQRENIYYEGEEGKQNTVHTRADGVQQIYLKDPDGYWVEVNTEAF